MPGRKRKGGWCECFMIGFGLLSSWNELGKAAANRWVLPSPVRWKSHGLIEQQQSLIICFKGLYHASAEWGTQPEHIHPVDKANAYCKHSY